MQGKNRQRSRRRFGIAGERNMREQTGFRVEQVQSAAIGTYINRLVLSFGKRSDHGRAESVLIECIALLPLKKVQVPVVFADAALVSAQPVNALPVDVNGAHRFAAKAVRASFIGGNARKASVGGIQDIQPFFGAQPKLS